MAMRPRRAPTLLALATAVGACGAAVPPSAPAPTLPSPLCSSVAAAPTTIAAAPSATSSASATPPDPDATRTIVLGPVTLQVTISKTAQLFYIIDQMSEWSSWCHPQYKRWVDARSALGNPERALLAEHKKLRASGWGALDRAFYTELDLESALSRAKREQILSAAAVATEREVLTHFDPILAPLLDEQRAVVLAFRDDIESDAPRLGRIVTDLAAFAEAYVTDSVPLFLIPNTTARGGGGGYNGGYMEVEAGSGAKPTVVHEVFHLVLSHKRSEILAAATACGSGLTEEAIHEGIAYALSPGIVHDSGPGRDPLAEKVGEDRKRGAPAKDGYVRNNRFGLTLRPLVESALVRKTKLAGFLTNACTTWKALQAEKWP